MQQPPATSNQSNPSVKGGTKVGDRMLDVKVGLRTNALTVSPSCRPTSARVEPPLSTWECVVTTCDHREILVWEAGGWTNLLVKLDHFPRDPSENMFLFETTNQLMLEAQPIFQKIPTSNVQGNYNFYNISDFSKRGAAGSQIIDFLIPVPGDLESENVSFAGITTYSQIGLLGTRGMEVELTVSDLSRGVLQVLRTGLDLFPIFKNHSLRVAGARRCDRHGLHFDRVRNPYEIHTRVSDFFQLQVIKPKISPTKTSPSTSTIDFQTWNRSNTYNIFLIVYLCLIQAVSGHENMNHIES